jgi:hypothetical protein
MREPAGTRLSRDLAGRAPRQSALQVAQRFGEPIMKYECVYNPNLNIVEVRTSGVADMTTMIEIVHRIAEICEREKSANILVDHSELDGSLLSMGDIETLSRTSASLRDVFKTRKCAHVVAEDYQFGLVRAWQTMVEINGLTDVEARLFKSRNEAVDWVKSVS